MTASTMNGSAVFATETRMDYGNTRKNKEAYLAFGVSVLLHLVALFWVFNPWATQAPANRSAQTQTISVSLITLGNDRVDSMAAELTPPTPEKVKMEKVKTEPVKEPAKTTPMLTKPAADVAVTQDKASKVSETAPAAQPAPQPASSSSSAQVAETQSRDAQAGASATKAGAPVIGSAKSFSDNTDGDADNGRIVADAMAAYKRALRQEMGKARQYPDYARRMGYSGRLVILVSMNAGQVTSELKGKSPHQELDEMGMKMVDFAIHRVPLPDALKKTTANFDVPILFQLID